MSTQVSAKPGRKRAKKTESTLVLNLAISQKLTSLKTESTSKSCKRMRLLRSWFTNFSSLVAFIKHLYIGLFWYYKTYIKNE